MKLTKKSLGEGLGKLGLWFLILAVTFWSFNRNELISTAFANYVVIRTTGTSWSTQTLRNGQTIPIPTPLRETVTVTSTQTGTYTESGPSTSTSSGTSTSTNCSGADGLYGGKNWAWCQRNDPTQQKNSQQDTNKLNNDGADQSSGLGMAAIAAGMAMVAAGVALMMNPPTMPAGIALIAAGMALIAAGMAALAAASKMNDNANKAGGNAANLDNLGQPYLSTISTPTPTPDGGGGSALDTGKANLGAGSTSGIKIDPALLRSGKMDSIMNDMEQKTGLNRDDVAKALAGGGNPIGLLANSPALAGKPAGSEANLQKMMDDTLAKGNLPSGQDVMDKLGLTPGDLTANGGGADPNRGLASSNAGAPNIDALFPGAAAQSGASGGDAGMKLSPEVQAALDKNGITGRTIFQMVHSQYLKKTPALFGVQNKVDGTAKNPFSALNGDKAEL